MFAKDIIFIVNLVLSIALFISNDIKGKELEEVLRMLDSLEINTEVVIAKANYYAITIDLDNNNDANI